MVLKRAQNFRPNTSYGYIRVFSESLHPKKQYVVFLDIDCIPPFKGSKDNTLSPVLSIPDPWARLEQDLRSAFGGVGHVFRTRQQKLKVAFVLELRFPQATPSLQLVKRFMHSIASEFVLGADLSPAGLFSSFVITAELEQFAKILPTLRPLQVDQAGYPPLSTEELFHPERLGERTKRKFGPLPALPSQFLDCNLSVTSKELLRCLCALPKLVSKNGYDLSQQVLANSIGVDQSTVSRLLADFCRRRLLVKIDKSFRPGRKAQTYRAQGLLKKVLQEQCRRQKFTLPTEIADGCWHETLKRCCSYFHFCKKGHEFLDWCRTLPNFYAKDRERKAHDIQKWFEDKSRSTRR